MKSTHLDDKGRARMVNVGAKDISERTARAQASVRAAPTTLAALWDGSIPKGDVLAAARIAGIQAAKKTPDLIPLCHQIALTGCEVSFNAAGPDHLTIDAVVRARDRTGVEMEALTAASVAALTVYDMLKGIDREIVVTDVCLLEKSGGRSGPYRRGD